MDRYDPDVGPDPEEWQDLDEGERLILVEKAHDPLPDGHPEVRAKRAHAVMHAAVENQLAGGDPPEAKRAFARLLAGGLDRHDAIHALANVVATHTWGMLHNRKAFDAEAMRRDLDALTPEGWRRT